MAVTLSTTPAYPVPGRPVRVAATVTVGTAWRLWCTAAPIGSELRAKLDAAVAARVEVFTGSANLVWETSFAVPGAYSFLAADLTLVASAHGGGYESDPDGFTAETLNATSTLTILVGHALEVRLGIPPDTARLRVYIFGSTIRETTDALHGDRTPRVVDDGRLTLKAQTAARDTTVATTTAALANVTAVAAIGDLDIVLQDLRTKYIAHIPDQTYHWLDDDQNRMPTTSQAKGVEGIIELARRARTAFNGHIRSRLSTGDDASGNWHRDGEGVNLRADWQNVPRATAGDLASAIVVIADLHRAYEQHRQSLAVHKVADGAHPAAALPPLLQVHSAFLSVLAAEIMGASPTQQSGVVALVHGGGGEAVL